MSISIESLENLQMQQDIVRRTQEISGNNEDSAAIMSQQIGRQNKSAQNVSRNTIDPAVMLSKIDEDQDSQTNGLSILDTITNQTSGILDAWDRYAANLAAGGSQKRAWNELEGMDEQVKALRTNLKGLPEQNSALEDMVNELEIMAATEKFRLNRGDYA